MRVAPEHNRHAHRCNAVKQRQHLPLCQRLGMSMWAKSETEAARCAALLLGDPARAARMTAAQAANIDANGAANVADLVERL